MRLPRRALIALTGVGLAAAALIAACGSEEGDPAAPIDLPGAASPVDDPFSGGYPTYDHDGTGLRVVFGTPDLGAGASRVSFALFGDEGLVSFPVLRATPRYYPDGAGGDFEARPEVTLRYRPFPLDSRGIYTGTVDFDAPGLWALDVAVPQPDGALASVVIPMRVVEDPVAPAVGEAAPSSDHRTARDVDDLHALTTAAEPDPALYQVTIADALGQGRPFVLTFASPAFCTNALCGPQVEVLSELHETYGDRAAFIHVDLYENPDDIRGDFSAARRTPALEEWGIHTDEWTFIVDADGAVAARFEGFAPRDEVEEALRAVLDASVDAR